MLPRSNLPSRARRAARRGALLSAAALAAAAAFACASPVTLEPNDPRLAYRRPDAPPAAPQEPRAEARVVLGRTLFFDPRLSRSNVISCATCHNPGLAWGDGLPRGIGHGHTKLARRTPTILNVAWAELLMWDGRFASLEEQALAPISAPDEMALPLGELAPKLRTIPGYAPLFASAFEDGEITSGKIAVALAAFERTVVSGRAPFDAWVEGDETAISEAARRGFALFDGELGCARCHSGWRFSDDSFHDIGVRGTDLGRGTHFEEIEAVQHAFKTPTLRDVARRAPYMHNGSEAMLADVLDLYDRGGRVRRPSLSPDLEPLGLSAGQKQDLLAFLDTLTSEPAPTPLPELPR